MIKANELRIGNWLIYHDNTFVECTAPLIAAQVTANSTKGHGTWVYPIRLTSKILENAGFEESKLLEIFFHQKHGDLGIGLDGTYQWTWRCLWGKKMISAGFQYVHQLQNLYFSLTGEELSISL